MFSQTVLAGRLGRDPEVRTTSSGKKVATLRICTSSYSKGKEYPEWHTVTAWGDGLVGILEKHVKKGDLILVTGQTSKCIRGPTSGWSDPTSRTRPATNSGRQIWRGRPIVRLARASNARRRPAPSAPARRGASLRDGEHRRAGCRRSLDAHGEAPRSRSR